MKRLLIFIVACSFFAPAIAKGKKVLKGRMQLSYGYISREQALSGIWGDEMRYQNTNIQDHEMHTDKTQRLFGFTNIPVKNERFMRTGALSLSYHVKVINNLRLGLAVTYEKQNSQLTIPGTPNYGDNGVQMGTYTRTSFTIAPECQLTYRNSKLIHYYGMVGFGNTYVSEVYNGTLSSETENKNYFAFQLTPFAMRVGRQLSGTAEFGFGYKGAVNLGVSYLIK